MKQTCMTTQLTVIQNTIYCKRIEGMYGYIYLTINLINGKKYIGKHYGELDDSYLGSGTILQKAINKYGKQNFKKEILYISKDEEENCIKEKEFI